MTNLTQLLAASALIVRLERIASSGMLCESDEEEIRHLICRACRAFEIPTIAERPDPELTADVIRFAGVAPAR